MTAKEFFKIEDPGNNPKYDTNPDGWLYSKEDMVIFADAYHKAKVKEL